jgi:hypothetical protein
LSLDVTSFPLHELYQVFLWNGGDQEGWNYSSWEAQMRRDDWIHYAVWRDDRMIGCVSLELLSAAIAGYHLAFAPYTITKRELRRLLVGIGIALFEGGMERLEAHIPADKTIATVVAWSCGFRILRREGDRYIFGLAAQDYFNNPTHWNEMLK